MNDDNEESKVSRYYVESAAVSKQPETLGCHLYHINMVHLHKQLTNGEEYGIPSLSVSLSFFSTRND
jgi:hypothetical protein